jgi:hypothetical protein
MPDPPVQLHAEALNETAIRLMWKEPTGGGVAVGYYNVSYRHRESDNDAYSQPTFIRRFVCFFSPNGPLWHE